MESGNKENQEREEMESNAVLLNFAVNKYVHPGLQSSQQQTDNQSKQKKTPLSERPKRIQTTQTQTQIPHMEMEMQMKSKNESKYAGTLKVSMPKPYNRATKGCLMEPTQRSPQLSPAMYYKDENKKTFPNISNDINHNTAQGEGLNSNKNIPFSLDGGGNEISKDKNNQQKSENMTAVNKTITTQGGGNSNYGKSGKRFVKSMPKHVSGNRFIYVCLCVCVYVYLYAIWRIFFF